MQANTLRPRRLRQLALALPVPLLVVGADLMLRYSDLAKLPIDFKAYYLCSIVFITFAWYAFLGFARACLGKSQVLGLALVCLAAFFYMATIFGAFGFLDHFSVLPNVFTFDYLLDEPADCWIYVKDALRPAYLAILIAAAAGLASYLFHAAKQGAVAAGRRDLWLSSISGAILCLGFHNNVRMGPNAFTPDVDSLFSLSKAIENKIRGGEQMQVVSSGARVNVNTELGPLPHHVLLILNESLRAKSQSTYGYFRDTTPLLRQFFADHSQRIVRFDHAYANATRTMLAFPSFFTGIVPSQSGALLHREPLVFDYGRAFDLAETFLISTQSMHWGNFDRFLDTNSLDFNWYMELSGQAQQNNDRFESLDDKNIPEAFANFLKQRDQKKKFFGVIQFTNTHAPYFFDNESDLWRDSRLTNAYDNSIHYNDRQMSLILAKLEQQGLLDDTLIISTSDHGEAFGEHGYYGHLNTFYDEEARVPFWIHLPKALAKSNAIVRQLRLNARQSISNADLIPTLLSLLTRPHFDAVSGYMDHLTGAPLDQVLPEGRAIYMQNYNDIDEKTLFVGLGLIMGRYKYLLKFNQGLGEEELYDLWTDPREVHNIWPTASIGLKQSIEQRVRQQKNSKDLYTKAFPLRAGHT